MTDHLEGLSSDDEETSTDMTNFNMERGEPIHFIVNLISFQILVDHSIKIV